MGKKNRLRIAAIQAGEVEPIAGRKVPREEHPFPSTPIRNTGAVRAIALMAALGAVGMGKTYRYL